MRHLRTIGPVAESDGNEGPLDAELFSVPQLQRHAQRIAQDHVLDRAHPPDRLLRRLADNERVLEEAYRVLTEAGSRGEQITPAAEWLVDNYHLLEEDIRTARLHLPRDYSRELPRIAHGEAGVPRVYTLALALVAHSHGRVDLEALRAFVAAYQSVQPLVLGELWAVPIMLRLALIENLRRVISRVAQARRHRVRAAAWAATLIAASARDPSEVVLLLAQMIREEHVLTDVFVTELASRIQSHGLGTAVVTSWLEHRVSLRGQTLEHALQLASRRQAADQVSVANTIGSLRFLRATDWRDFVEESSVVERALREDAVYAAMDFHTRDRYRHVVEALARRCPLPELDVAQAALALARRAEAGREGHVGYFLVDDGRDELELAVRARRSVRGRLGRVALALRLPLYVGSIALVSVLVAAALVATAPAAFVGATLALWATLAFVCASQLAIASVNWATTLLVPPAELPRLDFSDGIPDGHRTLVAVPTMLTDVGTIDELVSALEVRFLANRDPNLGFALVTDFRDASAETLDEDAGLLAHASDAIEALAVKYASRANGGFFLLHRARRWNPRERVWMGWERKRGKLEDLNAMLRGERDRFAPVVGPLERLENVKYVIALDGDTELPRDAARELAGALGHPLNRPVFDVTRGRVTKGYGILQPRVAATLESANTTRYAGMYAGECGVDPYTRAISDVYQDVFGEGSFIGKGIYDVDAFRESLDGRLPENRILSHDLLEGAYARSALISDVILYEGHPATFATDASRRSRWIRGDWQIARWLWPSVPGPRGARRNPLSMLSRWKILDNLRRSLVPAVLVLLLLMNWTALGRGGLALLLATIVVPNLLTALATATRRPTEVNGYDHAKAIALAFRLQLVRDLFALACLPYDALLGVVAIARAATRMVLTRRRLLEWRTAADAGRAARAGVGGSYRAMLATPLTAVVVAVLVVAQPQLSALALAAPLVALWLLAPALVWWASRPLAARPARLAPSDVSFLRSIARRTWRFFDTYVAPEENHLPPDNVQEDPPVGIAHRTSPTNIALALLANLAAYDFGYVAADEVIARCARTLATMDRLERHRGHFYNWYDTKTLEPLRPKYVSTVDSGNLAGHLLTLAAGLDDLGARPVVRRELLLGIGDTLAMAVSAADDVGRPLDGAPLRALLSSVPSTMSRWYERLLHLSRAVARLGKERGEPVESELGYWVSSLEAQCDRALAELVHLAPWCERDLNVVIEGALLERLDRIPTLAALALIERTPSDEPSVPDGATDAVRALIALATTRASARLRDIAQLSARCRAFADLDFDLVYDASRKLLAIGENVAEHRLDASYYDLLASEARLASYVGIAQGKLPQEHWFALGRLLTTTRGRPALLSWSGSMFEYLMPLLVMPTYPGTLLDATYRAAVERQIAYGAEHDVPWGMSESGYNKMDLHLTYQYRAFGVPGLGFKRGLADDLVIAPYASALGLMVAPEAACANLQRLCRDERVGPLGFYEAVDYTPSRLPPDKTSVTVRSYMAHHQGMALLSLAYALLDRPMQRRFELDPSLRATALLLQERVPRTPAIHPHPAEVAARRLVTSDGESGARVVATPNTASPEVHLLSNGTYHVVVTNAGSGYSRWRDLAVTRWEEDATRDCWGTFVYVRDVVTGSFWSAGHQPTLRAASQYEAIFSQGRAEIRRRDEDLDTHIEISVSPEDDVELRRITISNVGRTTRTIELTSYAEIVLAPQAADTAHRTFSNLFVETELVREHDAILCTRRPRSDGDTMRFVVHLLMVHGPTLGEASFETDRAAFIGRGRSAADPAAMERADLTNSEGAVLDPIVSVRRRVEIGPDQTISAHVVTGIVDSRAAAIALIEKYSDHHVAERVLELAWTQSQVVQRRIDASAADTILFERLAGYVLYSSAALRAPKSVLSRNRLGQSGLWPYGISGDLPIALVRVTGSAGVRLARQMLRAHAYWRLKGLVVDLWIWNEDGSGYRQDVHDQIMAAVGAFGDATLVDRPGGIFVRRGDQMSDEDSVLVQTIARLIVSDAAGTLAEQIDRRARVEVAPVAFVPRRWHRGDAPVPSAARERPDLIGWNGYGGFTRDGREYVITTTRAKRTPLPWVNVIANPYFGTVVSESGGAYTWCENAHEHRLTPWGNDPVGDASGEALYLRDEKDGHYWSPTPLPCGGSGEYTSRHGFGYTVFETRETGIASELRTFVATDAPVKFLALKLHNESGRPRRLSITGSFDLVLGAQRAANLPHVLTEVDVASGALFAKNPYAGEFAPRVAFLDCTEPTRTVSCDRAEVIGRNGHPSQPACMASPRLSGRIGAGLDPCLAMQTTIKLAEGETREVVFMLGSGRDLDDARHIVQRFRGVARTQSALDAVWASWNRTLDAVHVETPAVTVDFLANGWLIYQALACRMWGRSGFYQSGGAYGFRDQLQDAMALVHTEPAILREQILRAAAHQFPQGDALHWWHPPGGRGVRTRISDDYLWLPYAVCRYVTTVGDTGVLDERVAFVDGRPVNPDEDSYYDLPAQSTEHDTLYGHCVRAIGHGLRFGEHGLPLMGTGDWNDGMNLVGVGGKGESVWLAFFLHDVLVRFAELARRRGDAAFAVSCVASASRLATSIEQHGWDGAWYRRAYFDDGTPLGSAQNVECQVDSLPQSWAVLAGVGSAERAKAGLAALDARLVDRDLGVIKLFDPPFDQSALDPGYVKGYLPGVRENGGQYTHAAVWATMAFAKDGQIDKAWELLDQINPARHGRDAKSIETYRVEPYVMAADVYTNPQHAGRGGWTWYTGSAGWAYRLVLESLLGIHLEVDRLRVAPRIPDAWPGFTVRYRHRETTHHIAVRRLGPGSTVTKVTCDGSVREDLTIALSDDRQEHHAIVEIGAAPVPSRP